jgi:hypothetical protein
VRRDTIPAVAVAVIFFVMAFCGITYAAPFEFHGGVYTSYEYTDNYDFTAHNERSDSIYQVGPTAEVVYLSGPTRLDLSGHWARGFHQRSDQNNTNEIVLDSTFSTSTIRDSVSLGYIFTQTDRRNDVTTDVVGKSRIHTGTFNYTSALSPTSTLGLGYTFNLENNPSPYEDIVSHGTTATLSHQFSQQNSANLLVGYDLHNYEISDNTKILRSALGFQSLVTPRTSIGTDLEYEHQYNENQNDETQPDLPDSDIYTAFLTWGYSLTQQTHILLSGGYNWFVMRGMDREGAYAIRGEVTTRTLNDVFTIRVAREYTAEFTTDQYGTYDSRTASASWERTLLRDLRLLSTITYEDRKPVSAVDLTFPVQEEKDFAGMISLNWTPLRYLNVTPSYEHRERIFEIADTERENRYRIIAEVRY